MTTLTERTVELRDLINAGIDEVCRLCQPGDEWRMSVPADPKRDSDLLLIDMDNNALALLHAVERIVKLCDDPARGYESGAVVAQRVVSTLNEALGVGEL